MFDKTLHLDADGAAHLASERNGVCLDATYQIESLARLLPTLLPSTDENFSARHAILAIAGRITSLNEVLMGGLGDESASTRDLIRVVHPNKLEAANG